MGFLTNNWRLKVMALLLSMLLWLVFHYGLPAPKPVPPVRSGAKARR